jgi:hypothetical protein
VGAAAWVAAAVVAAVVGACAGGWARSALAAVERAAEAVALGDAGALAEAAWLADADGLRLREADAEVVAGLEASTSCPLGDAEAVAPATEAGPFDDVRVTPAAVPTAATAMTTAQTGLLKRTTCTRKTPGLRNGLAFGVSAVCRPDWTGRPNDGPEPSRDQQRRYTCKARPAPAGRRFCPF